jgi:hypothetical protein
MKSTVIGGLLSTLIATIILAKWPVAWDYVEKFIIEVWIVGNSSVSVSVSILIFLFSLILIFCFGHLLGRYKLRATNFSNEVIKNSIIVSEISANEISIIRLFASEDERWLGLEHIWPEVNLSRLVAEQALERLNKRGFLLESANYLHGSTFRLSSSGRDYAIDQGFVS